MENQPRTTEGFNQEASGQNKPEVKRTPEEWSAFEKWQIERDARMNREAGRSLSRLQNPFGLH